MSASAAAGSGWRRPDDLHDDQAAALMGRPFAELDARAQRVALHIGQRLPISRHPPAAATPTPGQRAADAVTAFGGSWVFVGLFAAIMVAWVAINVGLLALHGSTFDPYPFILLNLFLSMLAAVQAPIILMSQNRQSEKDRDSAGHDYEVNLKAELEIMLLHDKLDQLRQQQWSELLALQAEQMRLLAVCAAACAHPPMPAAPRPAGRAEAGAQQWRGRPDGGPEFARHGTVRPVLVAAGAGLAMAWLMRAWRRR